MICSDQMTKTRCFCKQSNFWVPSVDAQHLIEDLQKLLTFPDDYILNSVLEKKFLPGM